MRHTCFGVKNMVNFRKIRNLVYLALLGAAGTLLFLVNPTYLMMTLFSVFAIVTLARSINFYKVAVMLKRYARDTAKLRDDIRARLHTGVRDYHAELDDKHKTRSRTASYIR